MNKRIAAFLMLVALPAFAALSAKDSDLTKAGVYRVPVGQPLSSFALFNLDEVRIRETEDAVRIEYELPQELTGARNKIEMEGPRVQSGKLVLQGNYARMECAGPEDFSNCEVSYKDLAFDASARTALLQSISVNDEELRKRELVAARFQFGGEPHGFLSVLDQPVTNN